jgi:hypothetical protein
MVRDKEHLRVQSNLLSNEDIYTFRYSSRFICHLDLEARLRPFSSHVAAQPQLSLSSLECWPPSPFGKEET